MNVDDAQILVNYAYTQLLELRAALLGLRAMHYSPQVDRVLEASDLELSALCGNLERCDELLNDVLIEEDAEEEEGEGEDPCHRN